jgi:nondiscriminating aspartyl-tRNA synthetase
MDLLADCLRAVLDRISRANANDLAHLGVALPNTREFPRIRFRDAQRLLLDRYNVDCQSEPDLSPEHERLLGQFARDDHGSDFLLVTHYPTGKRPFYTLPDPADPTHSLSFDLLFRGAELVTGGQRINNYDQLVSAMLERGIDPAGFSGYLQAFRYGMPPEGGFAIGYERLLARLNGLDNIREATLFPRDVNRLRP